MRADKLMDQGDINGFDAESLLVPTGHCCVDF
jgi:hypothetical protein